MSQQASRKIVNNSQTKQPQVAAAGSAITSWQQCEEQLQSGQVTVAQLVLGAAVPSTGASFEATAVNNSIFVARTKTAAQKQLVQETNNTSDSALSTGVAQPPAHILPLYVASNANSGAEKPRLLQFCVARRKPTAKNDVEAIKQQFLPSPNIFKPGEVLLQEFPPQYSCNTEEE